jgi:hypothetical protein
LTNILQDRVWEKWLEGHLDIMDPHHVTDMCSVWEYNKKVQHFKNIIQNKFYSCRPIIYCAVTLDTLPRRSEILSKFSNVVLENERGKPIL